MKANLVSIRLMVLLFSLSLCQLSFASDGDTGIEPTGVEMATDLVLGRPAGAVTTVLGTGVWLVGLPFNAASGNVKDSARTLILEPLKYTFWRCLGCDNPGYERD